MSSDKKSESLQNQQDQQQQQQLPAYSQQQSTYPPQPVYQQQPAYVQPAYVQPAYVQPVGMVQAIPSSGKADFEVNLFEAIGADPGACVYQWCCSFCSTSEIMARANPNKDPGCCVICLTSACIPFAICYWGYERDRVVRESLGMAQGDCAESILKTWCCAPCFAAQHSNELKANGR